MESGKPILYVVATPIGNLSDMTYRAVEILGQVDFIAAEDTRVTMKLLSHFNIKKPLVSYYEHNKRQRGEEIIARMKNGESCAIVTDAGTPAISDPGYELVKQCIEYGIPVTPVPGASAVISALSVSGIDTGRFAFEGFLSMTKKNRYDRLEEVKNDPRTLVFYEAPHKLIDTLKDMLKYFGDRHITLVRELTKIHEEIIYCTISDALKRYEEASPRGEFVIVVEGANISPEKSYFWEDMSVEEHIQYYLSLGSKRMQAIRQVAKDRGISKEELNS